MANSIDGLQRQRTLEHRILMNFKDAPTPLPTLQNPSVGMRSSHQTGTRNEALSQQPAVPT